MDQSPYNMFKLTLLFVFFVAFKAAHSCGGTHDDPGSGVAGDRYIRKATGWNLQHLDLQTQTATKKMRVGYAPRRDPVDLADQIFYACDSNGDDALTWTEVKVCEEKFCNIVTFKCPSQQDFDDFDLDNNGLLTYDEYLKHWA